MRRTAVVVVLGLVVVAALVVPVPYVVLGPGSAIPVEERVQLGGRRYPVSGDLLLTTVSLSRPSAVATLVGWVDDDRDVLPRHQLVPEGVSYDDYIESQRRVFKESEEVAAAAGLRAAGLDVAVKGNGALVVDVVRNGPSAGKLRPGDLITAVDDRPVELATELVSALAGSRPGRQVTLGVRRNGEDREMRVELARLQEIDGAALGVVVRTADLEINLPVHVDVSEGQIGGPSAGLMIALAVYDLADPRDLTGGRTVAGTGTIALDGEVGPVGGVRQKVEAARRADASIFIVPAAEEEQARDAAGSTLDVIGVRTLDEAIGRLGEPSGGHPVLEQPR